MRPWSPEGVESKPEEPVSRSTVASLLATGRKLRESPRYSELSTETGPVAGVKPVVPTDDGEGPTEPTLDAVDGTEGREIPIRTGEFQVVDRDDTPFRFALFDFYDAARGAGLDIRDIAVQRALDKAVLDNVDSDRLSEELDEETIGLLVLEAQDALAEELEGREESRGGLLSPFESRIRYTAVAEAFADHLSVGFGSGEGEIRTEYILPGLRRLLDEDAASRTVPLNDADAVRAYMSDAGLLVGILDSYGIEIHGLDELDEDELRKDILAEWQDVYSREMPDDEELDDDDIVFDDSDDDDDVSVAVAAPEGPRAGASAVAVALDDDQISLGDLKTDPSAPFVPLVKKTGVAVPPPLPPSAVVTEPVLGTVLGTDDDGPTRAQRIGSAITAGVLLASVAGVAWHTLKDKPVEGDSGNVPGHNVVLTQEQLANIQGGGFTIEGEDAGEPPEEGADAGSASASEPVEEAEPELENIVDKFYLAVNGDKKQGNLKSPKGHETSKAAFDRRIGVGKSLRVNVLEGRKVTGTSLEKKVSKDKFEPATGLHVKSEGKAYRLRFPRWEGNDDDAHVLYRLTVTYEGGEEDELYVGVLNPKGAKKEPELKKSTKSKKGPKPPAAKPAAPDAGAKPAPAAKPVPKSPTSEYTDLTLSKDMILGIYGRHKGYTGVQSCLDEGLEGTATYLLKIQDSRAKRVVPRFKGLGCGQFRRALTTDMRRAVFQGVKGKVKDGYYRVRLPFKVKK